jgi:hypothetical protein
MIVTQMLLLTVVFLLSFLFYCTVINPNPQMIRVPVKETPVVNPSNRTTKVKHKKVHFSTANHIQDSVAKGLVNLGFTKSEAKSMVKKCCSKNGYRDEQTLLRDCFRKAF